MKRKSSYAFDDIIIKILGYLHDKGIDTPAGIAKSIGINPKTAQKYIKMAANLEILNVEDVTNKEGRLSFSFVKISDCYRQIYHKYIEGKNSGVIK